MQGIFITIEGGEGTGKTTLQRGLAAWLEKQGRPVLTVREPGGTSAGEALRSVVLDEAMALTPMAEALVMNAARAQLLAEVVEPALLDGCWVLGDRHSDSTLAYQSVRGVPIGELKALQEVVGRTTRPALTLVLDAPVALCEERRRARGGAVDVFEAQDVRFHERIRQAFRDIADAEPDRCILIDASGGPAQTLDRSCAAVRRKLLS